MTSSNSKLEGACITREQFLLRETRVVARLRAQGLTDDQVVNRVTTENLIQYPTDHMVRNIAAERPLEPGARVDHRGGRARGGGAGEPICDDAHLSAGPRLHGERGGAPV